jgi:hypothetical protein
MTYYRGGLLSGTAAASLVRIKARENSNSGCAILDFVSARMGEPELGTVCMDCGTGLVLHDAVFEKPEKQNPCTAQRWP